MPRGGAPLLWAVGRLSSQIPMAAAIVQPEAAVCSLLVDDPVLTRTIYEAPGCNRESTRRTAPVSRSRASSARSVCDVLFKYVSASRACGCPIRRRRRGFAAGVHEESGLKD